MKFIYCDESNLEPRPGDFLIYGGLTVDASRYQELSDSIWLLFEKYKIPRHIAPKYLPAPKDMNTNTFVDFKKDCIRACINSGCHFLVYMTLHDVARNTDKARRNGINEICLNFTYILEKFDTSGMILVDRFNDKGNKIDAHLATKFSIGLEGLPYSPTFPLKRIVGLHYSTIGQSHMTSLIDIILGTFRTAINIYSRKEENACLAGEILQFLEPLFVHGADNCIPRISISLSPQEVRNAPYRRKYKHLVDSMMGAGYKLTQNYGP